MEKLTSEEFLSLQKDVEELISLHPDLRKGQCFFNCLHEINPELADSLLGTENDPFYNDDCLEGFFKSIIE